MLFGWILCLLVASTQAQKNSNTFLAGVNKKLNSQKPMKLSGGGNIKALKEAKTVAAQAKRLLAKTQKKHIGEATAKDGGRLQIIVEKLSSMGHNLGGNKLNTGEKKFNNLIYQGLQGEALKATATLQNKIIQTVGKENAPSAAKLLTQMLTQGLSDVTKQQVKKLSATGTSDDAVADEGVDDEGVADEGVADEGVSDEGVSDEGVSDDGVSDDGVSDYGVSDDDAVADEGVDDEGVADEGVADNSAPAMLSKGTKRGTKKMCIFSQDREYCVQQAKEL